MAQLGEFHVYCVVRWNESGIERRGGNGRGKRKEGEEGREEGGRKGRNGKKEGMRRR